MACLSFIIFSGLFDTRTLYIYEEHCSGFLILGQYHIINHMHFFCPFQSMQEALKFSDADMNMHDWLERDVKIPGVILHDRLMTEALQGNLPIKTEHSYSLNSDGDSMPDSPRSLQNKIDGKWALVHCMRSFITKLTTCGTKNPFIIR